MITGAQCRAARALVEVTIAKLARRADVDQRTIKNFEQRLDVPGNGTIQSLQTALEDLGAVFIPENGGGVGVRLKFTRSDTKQIVRMEGEGGIVGSDTVP